MALHDVRDLEAHIRAAIRSIPGVTTSLPHTELEDLVADLIGHIWEASTRYDPNRGPAFSNLAHRLARHRTIDHIRHRNGYTRNGTRGQRIALSLDERRPDQRPDPEETPTPHHRRDARRNRLDSLAATTPSDPAESRTPDLHRALTDPRGRNTRLLHPHHQTPPRRAA